MWPLLLSRTFLSRHFQLLNSVFYDMNGGKWSSGQPLNCSSTAGIYFCNNG